ncbi:MAG: hypothetical protein SGARI_004360, partial [Bacillariaceae sp.]
MGQQILSIFNTSFIIFFDLSDAAEKLLELDFHEDCALSLCFITDGLPTDAAFNGLTPDGALRRMKARIAAITSRFVDQLNVSFVGFGSSYLDFSSLEKMAKAANDAAGVEIAEFFYCDKLAHSIGNAVSSLASSTLVTKTALACGAGRLTSKNTRKDIVSEADAGSHGWNFFKIVNQYVYDPSRNDWVHFSSLPPGAVHESNIDVATQYRIRRYLPPFLAMNKGYCGVSKDVLFVSGFSLFFFRILNCFLRYFAKHRLVLSEWHSDVILLTLTCSVLILDDPMWPGGHRGVLVEKQLDTARFPWRKWNNNGGGVEGQIRHRPMDVDFELEQLERESLEGNNGMLIIEEDSEEEDDTDDESEVNVEDERPDSVQIPGSIDPYKPSDYLQAFS